MHTCNSSRGRSVGRFKVSKFEASLGYMRLTKQSLENRHVLSLGKKVNKGRLVPVPTELPSRERKMCKDPLNTSE